MPTKIVRSFVRFIPKGRVFESVVLTIYVCDDGKEYTKRDLVQIGLLEQGEQ